MERLKIKTRDGRLIDIDEQYKSKTSYHNASAKMSFEEKIKDIMEMWKIVESVARNSRGQTT